MFCIEGESGIVTIAKVRKSDCVRKFSSIE